MRCINDCFLLILILVVFSNIGLSSVVMPLTINGWVLSEDSAPVIGASVFLTKDDIIISGTSTDTTGQFTLNFNPDTSDIQLEVSAIGYRNASRKLIFSDDSTSIVIALKVDPVLTSHVIVTPEFCSNGINCELCNKAIVSNAKHSLMGNDPIQVIRQPQVVKTGSNHSSKIRVNGTSPKYYINGFDIGYDPNHYGMISIIPASIVEQLNFYPQGTISTYQLPSVVDINTHSDFENHSRGEFNLSIIEATGSYSVGNKSFYALASLRESMLDKLIHRIDAESPNRRLPPTNFLDFFFSTGIKFSENTTLNLDQYYVRDYLYYQTDKTAINPDGVNTSQETNDTFFGCRFRTGFDNMIFRARYGTRYGKESYFVKPVNGDSEQGLYVDLDSHHMIYQGGLQLERFDSESRLIVGDYIETTSNREIELTQTNWNFLPPDYISDNPYIYQAELNEQYGEYYDKYTETNHSAFMQYERIIDCFEFEFGLRWDYFSELADNNEYLYRSSIKYNITDKYQANLTYGTYAESPLNRITEPYQVAIHDFRHQLSPIKTRLLSFNLNLLTANVTLFKKQIHNLPVLIPNFNSVGTDSFLTVQSCDKLDFYGGDLTLQLDNIFNDRFNVEIYYGYTNAQKYTFNTSQKYNLVSPHRFYTQFEYRYSELISFGSQVSIRSGYAYTPSYSSLTFSDYPRYSQEFLNQYIAVENTRRFPANVNINLFMDIKLSKFELYFNAFNVTDHDNPIISTNDGFIYDTGILPSIGIRYLL